MTVAQKPRHLSRLDIRRRADRATNSVVLEYTGRSLRFHDRIYGFPDGTFLVVSHDEMPCPPKLITLSNELHVPIEALAVAKDLKNAAIDAIVAEAMVKAPQMLNDFAEPEVTWQPWDARELERRHVVALARVVELEVLAEREMRLRAAKLPVSLPEAPPAPRTERTPPSPEPVVMVVESVPCLPTIDPSLATIAKVQLAVTQARESELAQRFPNGTRRALQKLVRAQYVVKGSDAPSVRGSLAEAMQDAEAAAAAMRKVASVDIEVSVVDWDGEWPVIVRRYGDGGRTVYRVEDALRRAGIEEKAA